MRMTRERQVLGAALYVLLFHYSIHNDSLSVPMKTGQIQQASSLSITLSLQTQVSEPAAIFYNEEPIDTLQMQLVLKKTTTNNSN